MSDDTYLMPEHGWTCFHCGETFTTEGSARLHFGAKPDAVPGCMERIRYGHERGLLIALRNAEERISRYMDGDTDLHSTLYGMQQRHPLQLILAEEAGYERGLRDAAREATQPPSNS